VSNTFYGIVQSEMGIVILSALVGTLRWESVAVHLSWVGIEIH
jgi:hypothetical protein